MQKGGGGLLKRDLGPWEKAGAYSLILALMLAPHLGLLLLSFGTVWSLAPLPDAYILEHYARVFASSSQYVTNTLLYAGLAAGIDIVLDTAIAYVVWRTGLSGRKWLDTAATAATFMLVAQQSDAPVSYGIYVLMQSATGRGPGAALGVEC